MIAIPLLTITYPWNHPKIDNVITKVISTMPLVEKHLDLKYF